MVLVSKSGKGWLYVQGFACKACVTEMFKTSTEPFLTGADRFLTGIDPDRFGSISLLSILTGAQGSVIFPRGP